MLKSSASNTAFPFPRVQTADARIPVTVALDPVVVGIAKRTKQTELTFHQMKFKNAVCEREGPRNTKIIASPAITAYVHSKISGETHQRDIGHLLNKKFEVIRRSAACPRRITRQDDAILFQQI